MESILTLVGLLEDHTKSATFDYSSTQLLATWLHKILCQIPGLHESIESLTRLSSKVTITRGQGQSKIWSLFRPQQSHVDLVDVVQLADTVEDRGEFQTMS